MESPGRPHLPAHLRAFLYSCIDSLDQLEILLLLRSTGTAWTARAVAHELQVYDARARALLDALAARGLVRATVRGETEYVFQPSTDVLAGYCEELADHYLRSRLEVVRFVSALPPPSIRSFAKAFRLRDTE